MSDSNAPPSPGARRSSFATGTKLAEMFTNRSANPANPVPFPGPIAAAAAANASAHQRRRMSISTLGLSGSPNQTSPFSATRPRQESTSSAGTSPGYDNESAIDESTESAASAGAINGSPFRRMSFGASARAMRDARGGGAAGSGGFNGRTPSISSRTKPSSSPPHPVRSTSTVAEEGSENLSNLLPRRTGEGFNWSEQIRSRAERSASVSTPSAAMMGVGLGDKVAGHHKAATVAASEAPVREIPKAPRAPDHFQERILKGDFYMD